MPRLDGKVAIVTGASRGIGKGIALKLAREGARVVVNYHSNRDQAETVVQTIKADGGQAVAIQANMTNIPQIESMVIKTIEQYGKLHILISNAGIEFASTFEETSGEDFDRVFATNTRGQFFAAQQAAKRMENGGRIILTSSIIVPKGAPDHMVYAASKGAVEVLARNLAVELGPRGITVNAIAPGATETDMSKANGESYRNPTSGQSPQEQWIAATPLGRLGRPEDIANVMVFLASEEGGWVTGQIISASGGFKF